MRRRRARPTTKNTIVSVKRYMGRGIKDVAHIESTPYDFVDAPGMLRRSAPRPASKAQSRSPPKY